MIQAERIESLRHILMCEQQNSITSDEAQEIGESMLSFFEILASNAENID
jgi:hypothetical protein